MATGFVWHELFAWHDAGLYQSSIRSPVEPFPAYDTPETKRRFRNLVEVSGLLEKLIALPPIVASDEAILRVHTKQHLDRLMQADAAGGGDVGPYAHVDVDGMRI